MSFHFLCRRPAQRRRFELLALLLAIAFVSLLAACGDNKDIHSLPEATFHYRALFIDDSEGLAQGVAWTDAMTTLGVDYDVEVLPVGGDPVSPLSDYRVIIWSVGDRPYDNLTSTNVATLSTYLDGGGRLLYSGGHSVYSETQPGVSVFIDTYLGLANYNGNMPTFVDIALPAYAIGTGHPSVGSDTYTLWYWPGGYYGNMFSGFDLASATGLLDHQPTNLSPSAGYIGAANQTPNYRAITWGFDLNHVDPSQQLQLLGQTLVYLAH